MYKVYSCQILWIKAFGCIKITNSYGFFLWKGRNIIFFMEWWVSLLYDFWQKLLLNWEFRNIGMEGKYILEGWVGGRSLVRYEKSYEMEDVMGKIKKRTKILMYWPCLV